MSGGIVLRAPRKMIIVNAVPRQILATITAGIGNDPSQSTGLAPSELRKTWLSEPKKKSYIATHRNPAISVGLTHASRTAPYARVPSHQRLCSGGWWGRGGARPGRTGPSVGGPTRKPPGLGSPARRSGPGKGGVWWWSSRK